MRIVFLNPSGELGGAETALLDMLAALRVARPSWVLALVASAQGPLMERAEGLGVPSTALPFPWALARLGEWGQRGSMATRLRLGLGVAGAALPTLQYASRLRRHLADFKPDLVHSNGLKMHLLAARCRPDGVRVLWHLHDYPEARPIAGALLRANTNRCAHVLANSESVAKQTRHLFGAAVPVTTLHNSIDLDRFRPDGPAIDLDARAGLAPVSGGVLRIGLLATFARWKGHDVFLDALARVRASVPVRGYIIGAPIYKTAASQFSLQELRDRVSAHGLTGTVGFTGQISDVPAALRSLDVVVHASVEPEPFGLVIAEAMACGRPVVVSRAGGAAEIAEGAALFHTPGDAGQLAEQLIALAGNPDLRASLSAAGRAAALRLFGRSDFQTN